MYDIGKLTEIARLCSSIKAIMPDKALTVTVSDDGTADYILMSGAEEFKETFPKYEIDPCESIDGFNILIGKIGDIEVHCVVREEKPLP